MALISADPVGVTDARPGVAGVGDTVQDILTRLAASLDAEGACWGDDEAGDVFAEHYLPAEAAVQQVLTGVAAGLHDVGTLLDTVSGTFGSAEHRARTDWEGQVRLSWPDDRPARLSTPDTQARVVGYLATALD